MTECHNLPEWLKYSITYEVCMLGDWGGNVLNPTHAHQKRFSVFSTVCVCVWGESRSWMLMFLKQNGGLPMRFHPHLYLQQCRMKGPFSSENFCVWRRCCLTDHRTLTSIEKAQHQSLRALTGEQRKDMNPWWCNIHRWFLKVEELNQKIINTVASGIVDFSLWSTLLTF